ncbi:hypothetical protein ACEPPN_005231 [Leptodophora sp. 'Broadleaf-Isolate-01']
MTERHTMLKSAAAGKTWNQIMTERTAQCALVAEKQMTPASVDNSTTENTTSDASSKNATSRSGRNHCKNCKRVAFTSSRKPKIW